MASAVGAAYHSHSSGPFLRELASYGDIMPDILIAYLITFGWAIVGSLSMGVGIIITLKLFTLSTRGIDEWELVKSGNIAIAIILAAVVISLGIVVSAAIHP